MLLASATTWTLRSHPPPPPPHLLSHALLPLWTYMPYYIAPHPLLYTTHPALSPPILIDKLFAVALYGQPRCSNGSQDMACSAAGTSAHKFNVCAAPAPTLCAAFAARASRDNLRMYSKFLEAEESGDAAAAEVAALFSSGGLPRPHLHSAHDLFSFLHR